MESAEVRKKFLEFFKERGHAIVPSSSLVPENDPTTLFTGSGMQPLIPYLLGEKHPLGKRLANSQKCFRTEDIDEVGDNRHTTFFEMLGNWSFGDYFKQEQLPWLFEFLTEEIGLKPENLYATVFAGDPQTEIPADEESVEIWKGLFEGKGIRAEYVKLGSDQNGSKLGMQGGRIFSYDVKNNWWSRAGTPSKMPAGEPGGPDSEVFYDFGTEHDPEFGEHCHPNCCCGRFLEIGNSVFMEYKKNADGSFSKLAQRNVDFGGGLERITAAANHRADIFEIDVFDKAKESIASGCGARYEEAGHNGYVVPGKRKEHGMLIEEMRHSYRVILDHMRSATFLIGDGVLPGKEGRGYLVRRLVRRAVRFSDQLDLPDGDLARFSGAFMDAYGKAYPNLEENRQAISSAVRKEEADFRKVLASEGKKLSQYIQEAAFHKDGKLDAQIVFRFVTTYGIPIDYINDEAKRAGVKIDQAEFEREFEKHRELSRTASAGIFKGGLADHSEKTTRLHTAHHLLLKALQTVLGPSVKQRGSNITSERLRMDFSYDGKMTEEQKKEAERIVNGKIAEDLPVIRSEMAKEEAEKLGAEHEFGQKYPDRVSVYSIGPKSATAADPQFESAFSVEFCGGPHVARTGEVGHFRIAKEEAVGAGIRRIRGVVD